MAEGGYFTYYLLAPRNPATRNIQQRQASIATLALRLSQAPHAGEALASWLTAEKEIDAAEPVT
jgi:hypothetical protein